MGFRFRKSVRLPGGVRVNVSKSGVGVSAGVKGARVGVGPQGTRMSVGVPGTGLGYERRSGSAHASASRSWHQITRFFVRLLAFVVIAALAWTCLRSKEPSMTDEEWTSPEPKKPATKNPKASAPSASVRKK